MVLLRRLLALFVAAVLTSAGGNSSLGQQSQPKIELDRLIRTYMTQQANYVVPWDTGSEAGTPISWQHAGIKDCAPTLQKELDTVFCRTGKVLITVQGKPTHTVLGKTVEPGHWNIVLAGPHAGIVYVIMESDVNSQELEAGPGLLQAAASKPGSAIAVRRTGGCGDLSDGSAQFNVTAPGKATAFLRETWSCGSGGCGIQSVLVPSKENAQDIMVCK
jgi:hypothetical protein